METTSSPLKGIALIREVFRQTKGMPIATKTLVFQRVLEEAKKREQI